MRESFIAILIRMAIAFLILMVCFYYFDPINALQVEAELINFILFGLYTPFLFTVLTITIASTLPLLFLFSYRIRSWWYSRPFLQLVILTASVGLLFISKSDYFRIIEQKDMDGTFVTQSLTNEFISLPGWFLLAFSILAIDLEGIANKLRRTITKGADWTETPDR